MKLPNPSDVKNLLMPLVSKSWEVPVMEDFGVIGATPIQSSTRTVRLEGWVEVEPAIDSASCCCDTDKAGVKLILPKGSFKGRKKLEEVIEISTLKNYFNIVIVEAWKAGTLPDSCKRWLAEVEL